MSSYAAGAKPVAIKLPFDGDIDALAADPRLPGVVFDTGTWTRFGGYYAYDPPRGEVVDTKLQPQGRYDNPGRSRLDRSEGEVARRHARAAVDRPRKGLKLDGTKPTILYGYGAYGISQTPFFRPQYLAWFERGGVFAVAHVRGGGENGEEWYKARLPGDEAQHVEGRDRLRRVARREQVHVRRASSRSRAAAQGGIFVGRSITERPELFGAAIDEVPVSDAMRVVVRVERRARQDRNSGTTETEAGFRALYAMSPYHHIIDGVKYPAVLVTTGINDPRVDAWQAAKMAARLQAATTSGKPVLLRVDFDAGHGIRLDEEAAQTRSSPTRSRSCCGNSA